MTPCIMMSGVFNFKNYIYIYSQLQQLLYIMPYHGNGIKMVSSSILQQFTLQNTINTDSKLSYESLVYGII
jgi:hypothetical protein